MRSFQQTVYRRIFNCLFKLVKPQREIMKVPGMISFNRFISMPASERVNDAKLFATGYVPHQRSWHSSVNTNARQMYLHASNFVQHRSITIPRSYLALEREWKLPRYAFADNCKFPDSC